MIMTHTGTIYQYTLRRIRHYGSLSHIELKTTLKKEPVTEKIRLADITTSKVNMDKQFQLPTN